MKITTPMVHAIDRLARPDATLARKQTAWDRDGGYAVWQRSGSYWAVHHATVKAMRRIGWIDDNDQITEAGRAAAIRP